MKKRTSICIMLVLLGALMGASLMPWAKRTLPAFIPYFNFKQQKVKYPEKYLVIDKSGKVVLETNAHLEGNFSEGLCSFSVEKGNEKLFGYMDLSGKVVIEPQFDYGCDFSEDLAIVLLFKRQYGIINHKGDLVQLYWPWEYQYLGDFKNGKAGATRNFWGSCQNGSIDKDGSFTKDPDPPKNRPLMMAKVKGVVAFAENGLWGYEKDGQTVISPKFMVAQRTLDKGRAFCAVNVSNLPNRTIRFSPAFTRYVTLSEPVPKNCFEPLAAGDFIVDLKYGLIDESGEWVLQPKYDSIEAEFEGLRMVESKSKFGFINEDGVEVIPPKFKGARPFNEGLAVVSMDAFPVHSWQWERDGIHSPDWKDGVFPVDLKMADPSSLTAAIKACDDVIKIKPGSATIYGEKAKFLALLNKNDQALLSMDTALALAPQRLDLLNKRGQILLRLGRWQEAEVDFSKCIDFWESINSRGLGNPLFDYQKRGLARLKQGKFKEAKEDILVKGSFNNFINAFGSVDYGVTLHGISKEDVASIFENLKDLDGAKKVLTNAEEDNRNFDSIYCGSQPIISELKKEFAQKIVHLRQLRNFPDANKYELFKSRSSLVSTIKKTLPYLESGYDVREYQELLREEIKLLEEKPEIENCVHSGVQRTSELSNAKVNLNCSYADVLDPRTLRNYPTEREIRRSLRFYKPGFETEPEAVEISHWMPSGVAPMSKGAENFNGYVELVKYSNQLGFSNAAWEYSRNALSKAQSEDEKRIIERYCQNYLSPDGLKIEASSLYQVACSKGPKSIDPELALKRCLKIEPHFWSAQVALARLYREDRHHNFTESQLRKVLVENPNFVPAHNLAESHLRKVLDENPNFVPAHIELGKLKADMHNYAAARDSLERALKLDPENQFAQSLLSNINAAASKHDSAI